MLKLSHTGLDFKSDSPYRARSRKKKTKMSKTEKPNYGPLMMLLASVCFSTGGLFCKMIPWSALAINGVRDLIGSLLIGIYILATGHKLKMNRIVAFGAVCMFGVTTLFVMANKLTTAANTIVLQYTAPVWILILMAVIFRQKPKKRDLIVMAVVFAGILCFFADSLSSGGILGDLLAVAAGVFYAGLFVLNSFENGDALSSLFFGQLAAGVILTPFVSAENDFSAPVIASILFLGAVQVGLAYIFFYQGTKYTHPVTASLIAGVEPVLNPILVAVFLKEKLSALSILGAVIVIAAIFLYNLMNRKEPVEN